MCPLICPVQLHAAYLLDRGEVMYAVAVMVVSQSTQAVLTKGILRGGGDTRFIMLADVLFLWVLSIPLGALFGSF
jgi:Na+-driven multidrug efflux pump